MYAALKPEHQAHCQVIRVVYCVCVCVCVRACVDHSRILTAIGTGAPETNFSGAE